MSKKVTKKPVVTADDVLNVEGTYLPALMGQILNCYYTSLLAQGFNCDQAMQVTLVIAKYYFRTGETS